MLAKIDLVAGSYLLERQEGTTRAGGVIQRLTFGPAHLQAEPPVAESSLQAVYNQGAPFGEWLFTFIMPLQLDGKQAEVDLSIRISEQGGLPTEIPSTNTTAPGKSAESFGSRRRRFPTPRSSASPCARFPIPPPGK